FDERAVYRLDVIDLWHRWASLFGKDVVGHFGGVGQLAHAREFDRILEVSRGFAVDAIEFRLRDLSATDQELLKSNDGAFALPLLDFRGRSIRAFADEGLLADHVPFPPIRFAFEQRRTFAGACASNRLAGEAENFHHVVTIDDEARNVVAVRALRDVAHRGHRLQRGELAVDILLAYED